MSNLDRDRILAVLAEDGKRLLSDPAFPRHPAAAFEMQGEMIRPSHPSPVGLSIGGSVSGFVLNDRADFGGGRAAPPVDFQAGSAWLKLVWTGEAEVEAAGDLLGRLPAWLRPEVADGAATRSAALGLEDGRRHPPATELGNAAVGQLESLRWAVLPDAIRALRPGDWVAVRKSGRLGGRISVRWGDLLTVGLGRLADLVAGGETLNVEVRATLSAGFSVRLNDEYRLAFARSSEGRADAAPAVLVSARKSFRRKRTERIGAGVRFRFAAGDPLGGVLRPVVEAVFEAPWGVVDEILAAAGLADLTPLQRRYLRKIIQRLGIDPVLLDRAEAGFDAIRARMEEVRAEIERRLARVALDAARLAFTFDYSMVHRGETLFGAELDLDALDGREGAEVTGFDRLHGQLMEGDLTGVLSLPRAAGGVRVTEFLGRRGWDRTKTWGLGLGVGKRFSAGGKSKVGLSEEIEEDHLTGRTRFSFRGMRSYAGNWGGDELEWRTTLGVRSSTRQGAPDGPEGWIHYLHFMVRRTETHVSLADAGRVVDLAVAWGVIPRRLARAWPRRMTGRLAGERDVDISLHLRLSNRPFGALIRKLGGVSDAAVAEALAEAMPWRDDLAARRDPRARRNLYAGFWLAVLGGESTDPVGLARSFSKELKDRGQTDLARFERKSRPFWPGSAGELAALNPRCRRQWQDLRAGARAMAGAGGGPKEAAASVKPAFRLMRGAWEQIHHVRAMGVLVRELLAGDPEVWGRTTRTLRIAHGAGDERVVETITASPDQD
ncbi:MAG: hypothetical protein J4G03_05535 [Gemmatimonadetes bacterium]|nr:hypothetical protein [Gemmatimonadota bacterium]